MDSTRKYVCIGFLEDVILNGQFGFGSDMGEIIGAGLLSHVPTIMLPKEVRLKLNQGDEISLIQ